MNLSLFSAGTNPILTLGETAIWCYFTFIPLIAFVFLPRVVNGSRKPACQKLVEKLSFSVSCCWLVQWTCPHKTYNFLDFSKAMLFKCWHTFELVMPISFMCIIIRGEKVWKANRNQTRSIHWVGVQGGGFIAGFVLRF